MEKKRQLKGAIHIHTTYSHDGTMSLGRVAGFLKDKGYDFIAITEHSYDVNSNTMKELEEEARALSTPTFLIIPGLEFRCRYDIDILGYGVTQTCEHDEPEIVIDHIHNHGGVAIFAHPDNEKYVFDEKWVIKLDGCEIYNLGNEGKFLPQIRTIKKFRKIMKWNPNLKAFCGLDLHRKKAYMNISTKVFADSFDKEGILLALKKGAFKNRSLVFNINSSGDINVFYMIFIYIFRYLLNAARWLRDLIGI